MVNKKGYVKTLEAVIAIVGILIFTFGVMPREIPNPNQVPFIVENAQDYIIETLQDSPYREFIINITESGGDLDKTSYTFISANDSITNLIRSNLPPTYNYEFKICLTTTCLAGNPPLGVSVYGDDVMVAGINSDSESKARIVRVWFWPVG